MWLRLTDYGIRKAIYVNMDRIIWFGSRGINKTVLCAYEDGANRDEIEVTETPEKLFALLNGEDRGE